MADITTPPAPATPLPDDVQPRGTTLATLGFLMAALGPIIMIVGGLAFGLPLEDATFFFIPVACGLLGAFLVRRRSTVARAVSIVLAVVIFMTVFWTAFGVAIPASFFDFVPGILVLPGVLIAIGGTVAAILASRRGVSTSPGERRAASVILGVLGVLAIGSAIFTITGRETVPDSVADTADVVVDLEEFEFDEDAYEVPAGGTVLVKNSDPFLHTFTIDDLDVDVDLGPGSEKLVEIPDDTGTYVLYCAPHTSDPDDPADSDMASEITVG